MLTVNNYRKLFCLFAIMLIVTIPETLVGQANSDEVNTTPKIEIIARPFKDSVLLRWAPNNSLLWEDANTSGYSLERITIMRNGELLPVPESKLLTTNPQLPAPLNDWENAVKNNKYAAIAAQALFGETFEVENKSATDLYSVITKVRERDTRFSFALFAADQSPEVAKLSGLWYTDSNVKENEKYLYRVYLADENLKADTGIVYTGPSEYQPLPRPIDLKAEFGDRKVNLSWNQRYFKHMYNSYILERSDDGGKSFRPVSTEPLVNLISGDNDDPELFYRTDSVAENNKVYYYRVLGINSFGERSMPSEPVSGQGHIAISASPIFTDNYSIDNNKIRLKWVFPETKNIEISGFKIARSAKPKTGYTYIAGNIPPDDREFTDKDPFLNNYYIITAFNDAGDETRSMPVLVQLIDSIPPDAPEYIQGNIDTTGKVTLCWRPNKEQDIFGYRIYRSNYLSEEFSQITSAPVQDTCFEDVISLKTLTKSVFYKIMAIDQKQNHSVFSEPVELKRPDKTPPVSPVFIAAKSTNEGVALEWINSSSPDVKDYLLYRSITGSKDWELISTFAASDSVARYVDTKADRSDYSAYTLIAIDFSGNESKPANPVRGKRIDTGIREGVQKVFADVNRETRTIQLAWEKPDGLVYRYLIYRAKSDEKMTLFKSISGTENAFTDSDLQNNTSYMYCIKVVYTDGSQSGFTKPTQVNY